MTSDRFWVARVPILDTALGSPNGGDAAGEARWESTTPAFDI